jgi:hypothetical protein
MKRIPTETCADTHGVRRVAIVTIARTCGSAPRPAVVDADHRSMRMRAAHAWRTALPERIVRMETDISCVAGLPGRFGVTVERAV